MNNISEDDFYDQVDARENWQVNSIKQEMERKAYKAWTETPEFRLHRLLNNFAYDITSKIQEMQDLMEVLVMQHPELIAFDKITMVLQQMRIVSLETSRLKEMTNRLDTTIRRFALQTKENETDQSKDSGSNNNPG